MAGLDRVDTILKVIPTVPLYICVPCFQKNINVHQHFRVIELQFLNLIFHVKWWNKSGNGACLPRSLLPFKPRIPSFPPLLLSFSFFKGFNVVLLNWQLLPLNNHHRHVCPPLTINLSDENKLIMFTYLLIKLSVPLGQEQIPFKMPSLCDREKFLSLSAAMLLVYLVNDSCPICLPR